MFYSLADFADFLLCTVFLLQDCWMICNLMDPATHRKPQISRTLLQIQILETN